MRMSDAARCRWCGKTLLGKPYHMGGPAYDPDTGERARINHYGGFVCSYDCDRKSSLELEQSMPGHGHEQTRLSCFAEEKLRRNWS